MKYLIVIPDGSADNPIPSLGGMTPLEAADIPTMDMLASKGEIGTVRTVPEGISPGSDSANLSVMGYDPRKYLTGRSPLEAAAIGVDMLSTDISFRGNPENPVPNAFESASFAAKFAAMVCAENFFELKRSLSLSEKNLSVNAFPEGELSIFSILSISTRSSPSPYMFISSDPVSLCAFRTV